MNSKERVINAINFKTPDRAPVFATLTPQVAEILSRHLGIKYEEPLDSLLSTRISHMELLTKLGNDCVGIAACAPESFPTKTLPEGTIINEWGMQFKDAGLYNEFSNFPLKNAQTKSDIVNYPFPDPYAKGRFEDANNAIKKYGSDYAIVADLECSIFETAWYLTGLEKLLVDLMIEAEYVPTLLDTIMEINIGIGNELIKMGADIIWCGDDFGTQQSMIMDPETWRKFFKPRIAFMFSEFRKINPDIKIAWHSCGSIIPIIPDFIEIGLDILNPIQPLAAGMNPEFLKKTYGKDLVFFGGVDVQNLLPNGIPDQIKHEIKRLLGILDKNGGFIVAPAHNIQPDTPVKNILAFFESVVNS